MPRYITHFESPVDGERFAADSIQSMHLGRPILARYDLKSVRSRVDRDAIARRPAEMWRYRELLPPGDEIPLVTLGETVSPLIDCPSLAKWFGIGRVQIKDESRLPGCSFKARGLAMAITMARHFGTERVAMASNGNAGGTMAIYSARAGMESVLFVPGETPAANIAEAINAGSKVYVTNGLIDECGKAIREGHDRGLWFDISTMKEPYRLEGKKTMGLELAEQFGWRLPSAIVYPTGGGTALIAMWKAFDELQELGWLNDINRPKMISVQSTGCQPLVRAFESGAQHCTRYENAETIAAGLRVPAGIGDFLVLNAVRESGGMIVAADENRLFEWQRDVGEREGIMICPETAACIGAVHDLKQSGQLSRDDDVVIFNTAAGQKYLDHLNLQPGKLDLAKIAWEQIEASIHSDAGTERQAG